MTFTVPLRTITIRTHSLHTVNGIILSHRLMTVLSIDMKLGFFIITDPGN